MYVIYLPTYLPTYKIAVSTSYNLQLYNSIQLLYTFYDSCFHKLYFFSKKAKLNLIFNKAQVCKYGLKSWQFRELWILTNLKIKTEKR